MMQPCELVTFISLLSCIIAEGKTVDEVEEIATILVQLGDTLTTIAFSMDRNGVNNAD